MADNKVYNGASQLTPNTENPKFETIAFDDENGNLTGIIGTDGQAVELVGTTDALTFNKPVRARGSSFISQCTQTGVQFTGAKIGEFISITDIIDVDGEEISVLGHTPLDVVSFQEEATPNTSDVNLSATDTTLNSEVLTNTYTADFSQARSNGRIENTTNSDITVRVYLTEDDEVETEFDDYSVPRKSGNTNGFIEFSLEDTLNSDILAGSTLQVKARSLTAINAGDIIVKGTTKPTTLTIAQYTDLTGQITANSSNTVIRVKSASDFGIVDSTKVYLIDGVVDMGSTSIEIPAGGINIIGYTFDVSQLVSSDNSYDMFYSAVGGSGNILANNVAFEASGTGSQVFNLTSATGFDAFEFTTVNFNNCTKIGTIDNYRQGLETGTGRFGGTPEIELVGAWVGGYFIDTSIVRSLDDGAYSLYKAGSGFTMNSRFRSNQNIDLPASASFFDFAPSNFSNPSTIQLDGCIISRDGVFNAEDANYTPNINEADLACAWSNNNGMPNTFVGGKSTVTTEITTTINTQGVFENLAGTFTETDLTHFDSPVEGQLRHLGDNPREFTIITDFVIDSRQNDVLGLKLVKWDNSASSDVDLFTQRRQVNALVGGRDVAFFNVITNIELDKNDYVYWKIANESSSQDATVELESYFIVNPR